VFLTISSPLAAMNQILPSRIVLRLGDIGTSLPSIVRPSIPACTSYTQSRKSAFASLVMVIILLCLLPHEPAGVAGSCGNGSIWIRRVCPVCGPTCP
jgi:hypothetical protein